MRWLTACGRDGLNDSPPAKRGEMQKAEGGGLDSPAWLDLGERGSPLCHSVTSPPAPRGERGSDPAAVRGEMRKAEGESACALHGVGLGVSPSVAARQLPLGRPARKSHCSDLPCRWRCHEVKVGSFRYLVRARPEPPSACGISPRSAEGEGKRRLRAGLLGGSDLGGGVCAALVVAWLGVSPSVAARQLPLGGSDWIHPSLRDGGATT